MLIPWLAAGLLLAILLPLAWRGWRYVQYRNLIERIDRGGGLSAEAGDLLCDDAPGPSFPLSLGYARVSLAAPVISAKSEKGGAFIVCDGIEYQFSRPSVPPVMPGPVTSYHDALLEVALTRSREMLDILLMSESEYRWHAMQAVLKSSLPGAPGGLRHYQGNGIRAIVGRTENQRICTLTMEGDCAGQGIRVRAKAPALLERATCLLLRSYELLLEELPGDEELAELAARAMTAVESR